MSRETQFIGLTQAAKNFVAQCIPIPHDSFTLGMFEEEVPLRKWEMHGLLLYPDRDMCIREVVQEAPWSSGPMIFTCLELDWGNGMKTMAFEWIHDPTLGREFQEYGSLEYDQDTGRLWA